MAKLDLNNVDGIYFDVLKEIGNIGAGNATTALAQLLQTKIQMLQAQIEALQNQQAQQAQQAAQRGTEAVRQKQDDAVQSRSRSNPGQAGLGGLLDEYA